MPQATSHNRCNTVRLRVVRENYIGVETRNFASLQGLSVGKLSYPNRIDNRCGSSLHSRIRANLVTCWLIYFKKCKSWDNP